MARTELACKFWSRPYMYKLLELEIMIGNWSQKYISVTATPAIKSGIAHIIADLKIKSS